MKHKIGDVDRARELLTHFDLMNPDDLQRARKALRDNRLPEFAIYVSEDIPTSDAGMRWAERRIQEMRNSGEISRLDNP